MSLRTSPTAIMLVSAGAWACFPVFIALSSIASPTAGLEFVVVLNLVGATLCWTVHRAVRPAGPSAASMLLGCARGRRLVAVDGAAIAASNVLAFYAIGQGNSIGAAMIIESWPVFAFLALATTLKKYATITASSLGIAALAVVGFFIIEAGSRGEDAVGSAATIGLAVGAAAFQVVTVVANQVNLARLEREVSFRDLLPLQAARMLVAAACAVGLAGSSTSRRTGRRRRSAGRSSSPPGRRAC